MSSNRVQAEDQVENSLFLISYVALRHICTISKALKLFVAYIEPLM